MKYMNLFTGADSESSCARTQVFSAIKLHQIDSNNESGILKKLIRLDISGYLLNYQNLEDL